MIRAAPLLAVLFSALAAQAAMGAEDGDKKQKAPEHKQTQSKSYVQMDDFYTTIVASNRPGGMLMVRAGLDVPDEALHAQIDHAMPVLRDAYLRNLMAFTVNTVRLDAQPDVGEIADRLQAVTDRALKKRGARVLLAQVAIRITAKQLAGPD